MCTLIVDDIMHYYSYVIFSKGLKGMDRFFMTHYVSTS